jgi:hypothetical protein
MSAHPFTKGSTDTYSGCDLRCSGEAQCYQQNCATVAGTDGFTVDTASQREKQAGRHPGGQGAGRGTPHVALNRVIVECDGIPPKPWGCSLRYLTILEQVKNSSDPYQPVDHGGAMALTGSITIRSYNTNNPGCDLLLHVCPVPNFICHESMTYSSTGWSHSCSLVVDE